MTAEIAILNRSAIALAADSAVTISVGSKTKVYDTAEKLFELSRQQPIALMIYNNVEFVGVPLDVLIRRFREERCQATKFQTMEDAANAFLDYMQGFNHDIIEEKKYLFAALRVRLKDFHKEFNNRLAAILGDIVKSISKAGPNIKHLNIKRTNPEDVLIDIINAQAELERSRPLAGYLTDISLDQFKERFQDAVEGAVADVFTTIEVNDRITNASIEFAFALMKSSEGTELLTGLVFGGFANVDMFPTLRYHEIDGIYFDRLKVLSTEEVDIDRMKVRAEVVPFAQKEMVERFMYGLDAELETDIQKFFGKAFDEIVGALNAPNDDDVAAIRSKVDTRFDQMVAKLKESSRQDLLDIVYFMSKKELADIAYALVELTSHKRRFSTEEQTVGGPIDVAILTKSEGLVWIRRKHYFSAEENRSYLSRMSAQFSGGNHGSEKANS